MSSILIFLLLCIFHTKADTLYNNLGYLDPNHYQKHIQSPNSRSKYDYEPLYTREVEAARKAHLQAYLDAQRAALETQKAILNNRIPAQFEETAKMAQAVQDAIKAQAENILKAQKRNYDTILNGLAEQQKLFEEINRFSSLQITRPTFPNLFGNTFSPTTPKPIVREKTNYDSILNGLAQQSQMLGQINFFSGLPITRPNLFGNTFTPTTTPKPIAEQETIYDTILNSLAQQSQVFSGLPTTKPTIPNLFENTFIPTTTPRPLNEHIETKQFVLPQPSVQHYEKIWPLPPLKFRDLAVEVNGQDRYDPKAQYNQWNNVHNYQLVPQNSANSLPSTFPVKEPILPPKLSNFRAHEAGLTAHQADLLKYSQGFSTPVSQTDYANLNRIPETNSRNRLVDVDDPVTKVVVTKSHSTSNNRNVSATQRAFENALNNVRSKYNFR